MSLEKIVQEAMAGRPLEMQEAFQEEIQIRMAEALEEKFVSVMEAKSKDEDDDEDDEDEDAPKSKDDDEDEDAPKSKDDDEDDDDKPAFLKKKNEEVEEAFDETLEEGPFKGIGKMMMKRKLNKTNDSLDKARTANKNDQRDARFNRASDSVTGLPSDERDARETRLAKQGIDMKAKQKRVQKATDRLNRKPNNDVKFPFNNR
jgi:hypothetical protein